MATSTTDVPIIDTDWTEIAGSPGAGVSGFVTLFGDSPVIFRQGTALPANTVNTGHRLLSASDFFRFQVLAGEMVYARSDHPEATLIVTLDG